MKPPVEPTLIARQERSRPSTAWTPPLLRVAEVQAARGNLRMAADMVATLLLADERILGLFGTLCESLFGLTPSFEESSGDGRRRGRAVRALEAEDDWWVMMPEEVLALHLIWGLALGVSLGRLEWWETNRKGKRVPRIRKGRLVPVLTWWHPRCLRWDAETERWFVRFEGGKEEPITPGDGEWLLFTPYGPHEPWLLGLWRGLGRLMLLKHYGLSGLGRHQESASNLFIESPLGANFDLRKEVHGQLENIGSDGVAVLPPGFKAMLLEVMASGELYISSADFADKAAAVAILGHAQNAEAGTANTGAQASENTRHERREGCARKIERWTHDQGVECWSEVNFGDRDLAPWPVYPTKKQASAKEEGDGLKSLADGIAAAEKVDDRIDGGAMIEKHGYPRLTEAEAKARAEERKKNAPPPPTPPAAPTPTEPPAEGDDKAADADEQKAA
jgi:hypothetical protein